MLLFSILLLIFDHKNQYGFFFAGMAMSISLSIMTLIVEVQRVGNYGFAANSLLKRFDALIFFAITGIVRFPVSTLLIVRNVGIVVFLLINLLFVRSFTNCIRISLLPSYKINFVFEILLVAYCAAYFVLYHPAISYRIFLARFSWRGSQDSYLMLVSVVHAVMRVCIYLYLLYPILFLGFNYLKGRLTLFFSQLASLFVAICALNFMFVMLFFLDGVMFDVRNVLETGFWRSLNAAAIPRYYASVLPTASFVMLIVISYLLIRFQTNNPLSYVKEYYIKKNLRELHENMRDVMHSEKNVIFNLKILSQEAMDAYGTEDGLAKLRRIYELSSNHIESLTQTINSIKDLKLKTINRSFFEVVNMSLENSSIPPKIRIVKNFLCKEANCNYDLYHMNQVITNLLENSIDALAGRDDPNIILTVDESRDWVYFSVTDNGCGIAADKIGKINKPYFSTKSRQNNWGVGLSYVFRVVKAHFGHIRIKSSQNEFTKFEILLTKGSG